MSDSLWTPLLFVSLVAVASDHADRQIVLIYRREQHFSRLTTQAACAAHRVRPFESVS